MQSTKKPTWGKVNVHMDIHTYIHSPYIHLLYLLEYKSRLQHLFLLLLSWIILRILKCIVYNTIGNTTVQCHITDATYTPSKYGMCIHTHILSTRVYVWVTGHTDLVTYVRSWLVDARQLAAGFDIPIMHSLLLCYCGHNSICESLLSTLTSSPCVNLTQWSAHESDRVYVRTAILASIDRSLLSSRGRRAIRTSWLAPNEVGILNITTWSACLLYRVSALVRLSGLVGTVSIWHHSLTISWLRLSYGLPLFLSLSLSLSLSLLLL